MKINLQFERTCIYIILLVYYKYVRQLLLFTLYTCLLIPMFLFVKAVEVIEHQRLSVSLFAPGWVYETQDKDHFFQHQERCERVIACMLIHKIDAQDISNNYHCSKFACRSLIWMMYILSKHFLSSKMSLFKCARGNEISFSQHAVNSTISIIVLSYYQGLLYYHTIVLSYYNYCTISDYCTIDKIVFISIFCIRFWSLLTPWICSASISALPLVSSFGRGYGETMRIDGKVVGCCITCCINDCV